MGQLALNKIQDPRCYLYMKLWKWGRETENVKKSKKKDQDDCAKNSVIYLLAVFPAACLRLKKV